MELGQITSGEADIPLKNLGIFAGKIATSADNVNIKHNRVLFNSNANCGGIEVKRRIYSHNNYNGNWACFIGNITSNTNGKELNVIGNSFESSTDKTMILDKICSFSFPTVDYNAFGGFIGALYSSISVTNTLNYNYFLFKGKGSNYLYKQEKNGGLLECTAKKQGYGAFIGQIIHNTGSYDPVENMRYNTVIAYQSANGSANGNTVYLYGNGYFAFHYDTYDHSATKAVTTRNMAMFVGYDGTEPPTDINNSTNYVLKNDNIRKNYVCALLNKNLCMDFVYPAPFYFYYAAGVTSSFYRSESFSFPKQITDSDGTGQYAKFSINFGFIFSVTYNNGSKYSVSDYPTYERNYANSAISDGYVTGNSNYNSTFTAYNGTINESFYYVINDGVKEDGITPADGGVGIRNLPTKKIDETEYSLTTP